MTVHVATPHVLSASTMIGDPVHNSADEKLGHIEELMIDVEFGRVAYAVLSFGGFLGMGEKLFAIPWPALRLDAEGKRFLLDIDQETLKEAPGFDKDDWPEVSDRSWGTDIYVYYGYDPYW